MTEAVFHNRGTGFGIKLLGRKFVTAIRVQVVLLIVHEIHGSHRAVQVHCPFADVTGHVVQTVIVGQTGVYVGGVERFVVQSAGHTTVVTTAAFEVREDLALVFVALLETHRVAVPWIDTTVCDQLVFRRSLITEQAEGSILPFGFRREAVSGQQDTVFEAYTALATGFNVGELFAVGRLVLTHEVSLGIEAVFVFLVGSRLNDAAFYENHLVDTVGTPLGVVVGLVPVNTYNRVLIEVRRTEVQLYHRVVVGEFFPPYECIGEGASPYFRISLAVNAIQPVEIFLVINVTHLGFIHVE